MERRKKRKKKSFVTYFSLLLFFASLREISFASLRENFGFFA